MQIRWSSVADYYYLRKSESAPPISDQLTFPLDLLLLLLAVVIKLPRIAFQTYSCVSVCQLRERERERERERAGRPLLACLKLKKAGRDTRTHFISGKVVVVSELEKGCPVNFFFFSSFLSCCPAVRDYGGRRRRRRRGKPVESRRRRRRFNNSFSASATLVLRMMVKRKSCFIFSTLSE